MRIKRSQLNFFNLSDYDGNNFSVSSPMDLNLGQTSVIRLGGTEASQLSFQIQNGVIERFSFSITPFLIWRLNWDTSVPPSLLARLWINEPMDK